MMYVNLLYTFTFHTLDVLACLPQWFLDVNSATQGVLGV